MFFVVCCESGVSTAFAENGPLKKFSRGLVNVVSAPLEIPKQMRAYWIAGSEKTDHILVWLFSGFVRGQVDMLRRFASGLWDLKTFAVEIPQEYAPLVLPEMVWEEWPTRISKTQNPADL